MEVGRGLMVWGFGEGVGRERGVGREAGIMAFHHHYRLGAGLAGWVELLLGDLERWWHLSGERR